MAVDPRLLRAINRAPANLRTLLLATALVESGGNVRAVGDSGASRGAFQENIRGRGAGLTAAQSFDPVGSTQRATREFQTFFGRGARGAELAYRAQRPADRADYIRKINAAIPQARQLLGGAASPGQGGQPGVPGLTSQLVPGSIDGKALMRILQTQTQRALAGKMPGPNYMTALTKLAQSALPRAQMVGDIRNVGAMAGQAGQGLGQSLGGFTMGGGPGSHASRALGNWQSDDAYDLMGKAGQPVVSTVTGRVTKISGKPGGRPGFAGYGITIETPQGKLFFKHLGSTPLRVGAQIRPGSLIGTLDPATAGGPHLHLGGTNRGLLDAIARAYTGRR